MDVPTNVATVYHCSLGHRDIYVLCKCASKERFMISQFLDSKMNDDVPALLSMSQSFFGTVDVHYINGVNYVHNLFI